MNWIDYEVEKPADGQVVAICTDEGVGSGKYEASFENFTQILMPGDATFRHIAYRIGFLYQTAMEWGSNSHFFSAKKIPGQFPGKNSVSISPKAGTIPSPIEGRPKYWFIQKNICPD